MTTTLIRGGTVVTSTGRSLADVLVDGEVSGAPEYFLPTITPSLAPTASDDATTTPTPSATPSTTPVEGADDAADGGGMPVAVPIAVGAAGLALLGGGTWVLLRRRRRPGTGF